MSPPPKRDGLYRVALGTLCAGYVIEGGKLTECAPILRKSPKVRNLGVWLGPDPRKGKG
jgi:hypothetical protein